MPPKLFTKGRKTNKQTKPNFHQPKFLTSQKLGKYYRT